MTWYTAGDTNTGHISYSFHPFAMWPLLNISTSNNVFGIKQEGCLGQRTNYVSHYLLLSPARQTSYWFCSLSNIERNGNPSFLGPTHPAFEMSNELIPVNFTCTLPWNFPWHHVYKLTLIIFGQISGNSPKFFISIDIVLGSNTSNIQNV